MESTLLQQGNPLTETYTGNEHAQSWMSEDLVSHVMSLEPPMRMSQFVLTPEDRKVIGMTEEEGRLLDAARLDRSNTSKLSAYVKYLRMNNKDVLATLFMYGAIQQAVLRGDAYLADKEMKKLNEEISELKSRLVSADYVRWLAV